MSDESIPAPDPIDEEAADIDARDPDASEEIEELIEHAGDTDEPGHPEP